MTTVVKIGCDPEGFIVRKDGKFISAAGLFPGTKKDPHQLEGGAVQVDGVALEFNIVAAETEEQFLGNIDKVVKQLDELVTKVDKDLKLKFVPIATFEPEDWEKVDPEAKVLGCDPDYNALNGEINTNPTEKLDKQPVRTAAGHIHIGWTKDEDPQSFQHFVDCRYIAAQFHQKHMKFYAPRDDAEYRRLQFYGHHGSFRPKSYGVELRSPSNLWVQSPVWRKEMYNSTRTTFKQLTGM